MDPKPIQYSRGYVEFYKLKFKVTPDVLIPRPETELLVDAVIKHNPRLIWDIGTGAGNIIISAIKNLPEASGIGTDISPDALGIATQNAAFHQVLDRIKFTQSNLLDITSGNPDVIVTNLPYIPSARIPYLDSSVRDYEPHIALNGGHDGFELYRRLFRQIRDKGVKFRVLIGEIDYTHGELAIEEALESFPHLQAEVTVDLAHKQRILKITDLGTPPR